MKKLIAIIGVALAVTVTHAQSNPVITVPGTPTSTVTMPPLPTAQEDASNLVANLQTVPLTNESFGLSLGTLMRGDSTFAADTMVDWDVTYALFIRGEIVEGTSVHGIESIGLGLGVYRSLGTSRIYGFMEGRRTFASTATDNAPAQWNGVAGLGIAYAPASTGLLKNFSLYAEERLVVSTFDKSEAPNNETSAGARYSF